MGKFISDHEEWIAYLFSPAATNLQRKQFQDRHCDVLLEVDCSLCGAELGTCCTDPAGEFRIAPDVHADRIIDWFAKNPHHFTEAKP